MNSFDIAVFHGVKDKIPKPKRCTWAALQAALTVFRPVPPRGKLFLPAWSPTLYAEGATRCADGVVSLCCIVLDFDDGTSFAEARAPWQGVTHILHTTSSHAAAAPRFRLVVPLAAPVPVRWWGRAWHWAHARAGRQADPSCKDPSRLYFAPAATDGGPRLALVGVKGLLELAADQLPATPEEVEADAARKRRAEAEARLRQVRPTTPGAERRLFADRLKVSASARLDAAAVLRARVTGSGAEQRAREVGCPSCGRASVWWPIEPRRIVQAMCSHRGTCGWTGWLDVLLDHHNALSIAAAK